MSAALLLFSPSRTYDFEDGVRRPVFTESFRPISAAPVRRSDSAEAAGSLSIAKSLKSLSDDQLTESFKAVATRERQATSDLIDHIREFEARKLYFRYKCTSLFAYMTEHLHYCGRTAQNRIDAARLIEFVPTLQEDLLSGEIKLNQVTQVAQGLRQKAKECPDYQPTPEEKSDLIEKIKGHDAEDSAIILARELDLTLKVREKLRHQKDESVAIELTLSKEQMQWLTQVKSIISHANRDASWAEVITTATKFFVERKDPGADRRQRKTATSKWNKETASSTNTNTNTVRQPIPAATRRLIFQRDRVCQWRHDSGETCGSLHQLQVDHIISVCEGGTNDIKNLQLLCGGHNRLKYRLLFARNTEKRANVGH